MKQKLFKPLLILFGCLAIVPPVFAQAEVQTLQQEVEKLRKRVEVLESAQATPFSGLTGKELDRYDLSTPETIIRSLQQMEQRFDLPALYSLFKRFAISQVDAEGEERMFKGAGPDFARIFTSRASVKAFRSITVTESGDQSNVGLTISLLSYQLNGKEVRLVMGFRRYPPFPYLVPDMDFGTATLSASPYNTVEPSQRTKQDTAVEKALTDWMGKSPAQAAAQAAAEARARDNLMYPNGNPYYGDPNSKGTAPGEHKLKTTRDPIPDDQEEAERIISGAKKGNEKSKH